MPSCSSAMAAFRISASCLALAGRAPRAVSPVPASTAMPAAVNVRPLPISSPRRDAIGRIKSLMALVSSFWVKPGPRLNTERRERAGGQPLAIGAGELEGLRENAADLRIERLHQLA